MLSGPQQFGAALTGAGMLFFAAGILLLLDKGLMAVGNLLFLTGITLLIGPNRIVGFFFRQDRINSTVCFFGGIVLVLIKWPFVGLILESVGIFNLFGPFIPMVLRFLSGLVSYIRASL